MANFRLSQTEESAGDCFKFDENGGKFSKRIENTVGKGEIAHHEQFLLFQQCFQKTSTADTKKPGLVQKGLTYKIQVKKCEKNLLEEKTRLALMHLNNFGTITMNLLTHLAQILVKFLGSTIKRY